MDLNLSLHFSSRKDRQDYAKTAREFCRRIDKLSNAVNIVGESIAQIGNKAVKCAARASKTKLLAAVVSGLRSKLVCCGK